MSVAVFSFVSFLSVRFSVFGDKKSDFSVLVICLISPRSTRVSSRGVP